MPRKESCFAPETIRRGQGLADVEILNGSHVMEAGLISELRELCRSVAQEEDPGQVRVLLDQLLRALDERELLSSLL
jgi:hypothetical protein